MTPQKKKRLKRALLGTVLACAVIGTWDRVPLTRQLEQQTLDFRYQHFNRDTAASKEVVVIDIDDQSLKLLAPAYGRWPWPRRVYKDLIEFISIGEPAAIIFDIVFSESQLGSDDDVQLAQASAAIGKVSHALQFLPDPAEEREGINPLPEDLKSRFAVQWSNKPPAATQWEIQRFRDYLPPAPDYMARIPRVHAVNFLHDRDGTFRRTPLLFPYDGAWFPSLSLAGVLGRVVSPRLGFQGDRLEISGEGGEILNIPVDERGFFHVHYYSNGKDPESLPIATVLDSARRLQEGNVDQLKVDPTQEFGGKVVLIGGSAMGLMDLKPTPIQSAYPGTRIQATVISNILSGDFLTRLPLAPRLLIAFALALLSYGCALFTQAFVIRLGFPLLAISLYLATAIVVFRSHNLWIDMALPTLACLGALFDSIAYLSFVEGRDRRKLQGTLAKYVPPAIAEKLIEQGTDPHAEVGQSRELSILFSDIRGFTTLSERLEAPVVVERLNEYLGRMTDVVFKNQGTLDKFIGDAVMAFWGAPLPDERHALHAVRTAFQMQEALAALMEEWRQRGLGLELAIGVGINTGPVVVGNIGSEKRLDYTVIGDNVNTASRMEGLTKQYQVQILIGERTRELLGDAAICRPIDNVRAKGKNKPIRIYEPLAERESPKASSMTELSRKFEAAFEAYQEGRFESALEQFRKLNAWRVGGDGPSRIYIERCEILLADPPPAAEWDGVFVAKSK